MSNSKFSVARDQLKVLACGTDANARRAKRALAAMDQAMGQRPGTARTAQAKGSGDTVLQKLEARERQLIAQLKREGMQDPLAEAKALLKEQERSRDAQLAATLAAKQERASVCAELDRRFGLNYANGTRRIGNHALECGYLYQPSSNK